MAEALKIGDVARRADVTVDTVRFYERRGVLPIPRRRLSGYRQYSEATVERIRFAKSLKALGFTLDEIAGVLRSVDAGMATCERERPRFESVLARIDGKIGDLTAIRRSLLATLERCRAGRCALLEKVRGAENKPSKPAPARSRRRLGAKNRRT